MPIPILENKDKFVLVT